MLRHEAAQRLVVQRDKGAAGVLRTVEGFYRNGRIELAEAPGDVPEETRVLVTFLEPQPVDLRERGISERRAAELRARLTAFAEEWDSPDMDVYDDYDAARARMQAR
jgi:hypothetical protein